MRSRIGPSDGGASVVHVLRSIGLAAVVLVLLPMPSAFAQRFGRRFRAAPPPRPPAGAVPAPARSPAPTAPGAAPEGSGTARAKERPQTTSAPASKAETPTAAAVAPPASDTVSAADVAWQGVAPFSEAWRRLHPSAWHADAPGNDVTLAVGDDMPTSVDRLASHDEPPATAGSVLAGGLREPALLVFPDEPSAAAAEQGGEPSPSAPSAVRAEDGTVSVLMRDGSADASGTSAGKEPGTGEPGLLVAGMGNGDPRGPAWLPLGAFAAVPAGSEEIAVPHVFLEMSLHRDGRVRGNYFDALSDAVHPLEGSFDREAGLLRFRVGRGAEFEARADGLAAGRGQATVRSGDAERAWTLIGLR